MIDANEYSAILNEHGRRVANRVAFSSMSKDERASSGIEAFYLMYGDERDLPEDERTRPDDPATTFDPAGWNAFYSQLDPWAQGYGHWRNRKARGRKYWAKELYETLIAGESGIRSLHYVAWLVTLTADEATAEHARLSAMTHDVHAQEWAAWIDALEPEDVIDIWVLLYRRYPSPNTYEQFDAQVQPYRIGNGPIPNEQAAASLMHFARRGTECDYSEKFGKSVLSAEEEALRMKGTRTQIKIDRRTNK